MARYAGRRLIGMIPTVLVLLGIVVVLIRMLPGDIVDILLSQSGQPSAEARAMVSAKLGIDKPLLQLYAEYALGVFRGDLGKSLWDTRSVTKIIGDRAPVTAEVACVAIFFSVIISIPLGVISAVRRGSMVDHSLRIMSILGISLPGFVLATSIVILPALWWKVSLPFQYTNFWTDPYQNMKLVLPAAGVNGVLLSASIARMMRTTMLDVLNQDYMRTARAKGLSTSRIIIQHGLKNALIPVVTLLGLQVTVLVGGSVITESVFALPGLGRLLLDSLTNRDYPIIQGVVVCVGILVMLTNLLVDLSYGYLDPRIRYS
ncbi:MAG: ABC transporter permease [Dehalococcoidia bacterium]|nr:ABC transporter permease [Dehalococcoidia bacterium]